MDIWQSNEDHNGEPEGRIEAALLGIRPSTALGVLVATSLAIAIPVLYLPESRLDSTGFRVLMQVSFKLAVGLWIQADARSRGWPTSRSVFYLCFTLISVLIGYLVYLVVSRGWRGALATAVRASGLLLLVLVLATVSALVLESVWGVPAPAG